jgi:hypothetical protein
MFAEVESVRSPDPSDAGDDRVRHGSCGLSASPGVTHHCGGAGVGGSTQDWKA